VAQAGSPEDVSARYGNGDALDADLDCDGANRETIIDRQ
jgi:hypothetical protein